MSRIFECGSEKGSAVDTGDRERSRTFAALGYSTQEDARAAFLSYAAANSLVLLGGLVLGQIDPTQVEGSAGNWIVEATWTPFIPKVATVASDTLAASEPEFNFSFSLSTEKIFVPIGSQNVRNRTGAAGTPPDIALIGDQGDGKPPAGVDLLVPEIAFGEKRYLKQSYWTEATRATFLRLIGKVNTTPFRGFDPGEVLQAGISGAARGRDDIELQFAYRVRENRSQNIPGFAAFDKLGWHYLWPRHTLKAGSGSEKIVTNEIEFIVTCQVFETTAFTSLE